MPGQHLLPLRDDHPGRGQRVAHKPGLPPAVPGPRRPEHQEPDQTHLGEARVEELVPITEDSQVQVRTLRNLWRCHIIQTRQLKIINKPQRYNKQSGRDAVFRGSVSPRIETC